MRSVLWFLFTSSPQAQEVNCFDFMFVYTHLAVEVHLCLQCCLYVFVTNYSNLQTGSFPPLTVKYLLSRFYSLILAWKSNGTQYLQCLNTVCCIQKSESFSYLGAVLKGNDQLCLFENCNAASTSRSSSMRYCHENSVPVTKDLE
jgi:hypothetical protein